MMKQAQEITENGDQPPERCIRKQDEEYGANYVSNTAHVITAAAIPVIDFSLLISSQSELDKLKSAPTTLGCFQAITHGIESSFLEEVREISKLFFKLPDDEKKKCLKEQNDVQGYGNETVLSDNQTRDWADRLYLTILRKTNEVFNFGHRILPTLAGGVERKVKIK